MEFYYGNCEYMVDENGNHPKETSMYHRIRHFGLFKIYWWYQNYVIVDKETKKKTHGSHLHRLEFKWGWK